MVVLIDYRQAFDNIETWSIERVLNNRRIYTPCLRQGLTFLISFLSQLFVWRRRLELCFILFWVLFFILRMMQFTKLFYFIIILAFVNLSCVFIQEAFTMIFINAWVWLNECVIDKTIRNICRYFNWIQWFYVKLSIEK